MSETKDEKYNLILALYEKLEERYENKATTYGFQTGFYEFDTLTGGLHNSELTVIAGRHSMGKSAFAVNVLNNLTLKVKVPTLFVSYEMNKYTLATRMFAAEAEIESYRINTGNLKSKDWEKCATLMTEFNDRINENILKVIPSCILNYKELFDEIRFFARENNECVVIIDYFQLIKLLEKEDRITELSYLAAAFKRLAIELDIPIILLSQVSKKCEERTDKRPRLSDLSECDALAQHADNIIFLYRDNYYRDRTEEDEILSASNKGEAEMIIAKQKNGAIGTVKLLFCPSIWKFKNPIKADMF